MPHPRRQTDAPGLFAAVRQSKPQESDEITISIRGRKSLCYCEKSSIRAPFVQPQPTVRADGFRRPHESAWRSAPSATNHARGNRASGFVRSAPRPTGAVRSSPADGRRISCPASSGNQESIEGPSAHAQGLGGNRGCQVRSLGRRQPRRTPTAVTRRL